MTLEQAEAMFRKQGRSMAKSHKAIRSGVAKTVIRVENELKRGERKGYFYADSGMGA